jgi:hypothetical protein
LKLEQALDDWSTTNKMYDPQLFVVCPTLFGSESNSSIRTYNSMQHPAEERFTRLMLKLKVRTFIHHEYTRLDENRKKGISNAILCFMVIF